MTRIPPWPMVIIAIALAVLGGRAISAQDKYSREHAPGIPEPGEDSALVSAESPPVSSRHAIVPDLPAAAPFPDPQGPPAAEQPADALAVNPPEPSTPVSTAPDLPAEAATPELHPQVAEKPAKAVNTPEHHLDASPPNYTALPPVTTAPPSVDVTALANDVGIVPKPVRKPAIQNPVGKPVTQKPATAPPSRKRAQIGIFEKRRMLREGLMSPGFLPPR
jgi:hypothetical protein